MWATSNRKQSVTCKYHVKVKNENIEEVSKAINLGIFFKTSLALNEHIIAKTGKIFGMPRNPPNAYVYTDSFIYL